MNYRFLNVLKKTSICLTILFFGLMSASITHDENYSFATNTGPLAINDTQINDPYDVVDLSGNVYMVDCDKNPVVTENTQTIPIQISEPTTKQSQFAVAEQYDSSSSNDNNSKPSNFVTGMLASQKKETLWLNILIKDFTILGSSIVTLISVFASIIAIYDFIRKKREKNSLADKDQIDKSISELYKVVMTGDIHLLESFMESKNSLYIPNNLKKKIIKEINKECSLDNYYQILKIIDKLVSFLKGEKYLNLHYRILNIINKYLNP